MNFKKSLENRFRGWFPQEPTIPKSSAKIGYQPLPREPWVSRNRLAFGLIGGVLTVLIGVSVVFFGLIFSDILRSYNIYATGQQNPLQIAIQDFVLGGVGLAAGIIGIMGSRKANHRGGIMLIIAGAISLSFPLWGILPAALMLLSGITQIRKKPLEASKEPGKFVLFITRLWRFENVATFSMNLAVLAFFTFLFSQLYNEFQDSGGLFLLFYPLLFIYPLMRKKDALKSVFSKIFFAFAFILIVLTGIFFSFHIITSTGFVAISLITVPTFTLLYAWVENFPKHTASHSHQAKNKQKTISTIFVLAGIILLVFSLALASHIEQQLRPVRHNEIILRQDFNLTQQIPDTTLSVNLTTQDRLAFGIFPADYFSPHSKGYSSVDFSISYHSALGEPLVKVYEYNNISSHNRDPIGSWAVTQNGTYTLNLHYNYNATTHINENIGRYWSTIELVPTTVYTPLLADYLVPTLIISSALLIVSVAFPLQLFSKAKSIKNEHYNEFPFSTPPPPPQRDENVTIKKSLENRIRGSFPKEPYLLTSQVKVNCAVNIEIKNPPPKIPQGYTINATKNARNIAIYWIIYGLFFSSLFLNNERYNIALLVAWVIVGVAVGIISGKMYTQNQLSRLLNEVEIYTTRKDRIFAIVPFLIIFPFVFLVSLVLFNASIYSSLGVFLFSVFGGAASQKITRYVLFRSFEKNVDMRLMERFGGGIVVIPKLPNRNSTV